MVLDANPRHLRSVAQRAESLYRRVSVPRQDGSDRICFDAKGPIKDIHENIKLKLLDQVAYPRYLQCGIRDLESPRDFVRSASAHLRASLIYSTDIANFFPSVSKQQIYAVWHDFFHFSDEVAGLLTMLTSYRNDLPQGSKASQQIANLIFFRSEPSLVQRLNSLGLTYVRYADDIAISGDREAAEHIRKAVGAVDTMIRSYGMKKSVARKQ